MTCTFYIGSPWYEHFSFYSKPCNIFLIMFVIWMYILTVYCSLEIYFDNVNRRFIVFTWPLYVNIFIYMYRKCNLKVCHYLPLFYICLFMSVLWFRYFILYFFCWHIKICFSTFTKLSFIDFIIPFHVLYQCYIQISHS